MDAYYILEKAALNKINKGLIFMASCACPNELNGESHAILGTTKRARSWLEIQVKLWTAYYGAQS